MVLKGGTFLLLLLLVPPFKRNQGQTEPFDQLVRREHRNKKKAENQKDPHPEGGHKFSPGYTIFMHRHLRAKAAKSYRPEEV